MQAFRTRRRFGINRSNLYLHLLTSHGSNSVNPCYACQNPVSFFESPKGLLRKTWNCFISLACSFGNRQFDALNIRVRFLLSQSPRTRSSLNQEISDVACVIYLKTNLLFVSDLSSAKNVWLIDLMTLLHISYLILLLFFRQSSHWS